jgi:hypothetical protein
MASNTTKSDNGAIYGSTYEVTIDGYAYVFKTIDHQKNVSGIVIKDSSGLFKGGAYVVDQEVCAVEIDAISGTPAPSQLVPFAQAFHGFSSLNWMVHNLSIKSGNEQGRTYSAEIKQYKAAIT